LRICFLSPVTLSFFAIISTPYSIRNNLKETNLKTIYEDKATLLRQSFVWSIVNSFILIIYLLYLLNIFEESFGIMLNVLEPIIMIALLAYFFLIVPWKRVWKKYSSWKKIPKLTIIRNILSSIYVIFMIDILYGFQFLLKAISFLFAQNDFLGLLFILIILFILPLIALFNYFFSTDKFWKSIRQLWKLQFSRK
jgi:hypothetical protein